jgi:hypothetical protein
MSYIKEIEMVRNNLFQNIVNDENSFTELLCNLLSLKDLQFKEKFFKFLGIKNPEEYDFDTQYRTDKEQNNGRPDLIISSNETIFFIENKVNNTRLTKNQPKGYLKELVQMDCKEKNLYFIIPKYYSHKDELNDRLIKFNKDSKICTKILFWDDFFEKWKREDFSEKNDILFHFFQLIKEWFGYDHIILPKKGDIEMNVKEFGKQLFDFELTVSTVEALIRSNGFKTKPIKLRGEIGFHILDKKDNILGYFEIWNALWAAKGDIFVFIPENDCDFVKKEFEFDGRSYPYISLDSKILNGVFEEKAFVDYFLDEILKKLVK